ncbi:ATP-dependent DNA helicase RecG [Fervidicella metallireducens AeB]|uniref:ATP-dependent DNA helicase RecG n=1 Tax=Fervidicella metallireducens AeB TaxID=1403537 RepID=A0A017RY00_9CLOT|nr:ATP-dependent DNA helicase RecG [Fervidicella metallireducens]EYE89289.1 ATP-dependent DNA helicase RecG [Fervidicella metallireducens AeB]
MKINELKGVGSKTEQYLLSLGINEVKDAIYFFPRDYEDRNNIKCISETINDEFVTLICEVSLILPTKKLKFGKYINKIIFKDNSGFLTGVWFNQPYIKNNFQVGERVILSGKITRKFGEIQIIDPQYDKDFNVFKSINPIYPTNKNLSQKILKKIISQSLLHIDTQISEMLHSEILKRYEILPLKDAIMNLHYPNDRATLNKAQKSIKFYELLILQLCLLQAKKTSEENKNSFSIKVCREMKDFKNSLPFQLTTAQSKVVREILTDLKNIRPMNRLVQGDVGSGKTVIAAIAMFNCAMNGYQCAMMAPTEILAEQHFNTLRKLFGDWNVNIELITGSTPQKQKRQILERLAEGDINIIIGTHALIQENVDFNRLALVVTDEQHRFGVRQRAELVNKGHNPHVLVMTATPIPRTLALFIYGDMDISLINELPPGRQKINTYAVRSNLRERAYNFIKQQILLGRQAYVVCPLVEESEKIEAQSALETAEKLKNIYFKEFKIDVLHGKLKSTEKDNVMKKFKEGDIDILVSTTVIEVGVNVPNATIMLIENADRFGLAQLHQLRGRVGRGIHKSYCILISDASNKETKERLKIMTETNDGFVIAEKDMFLRGTGEFFGLRQHGLPELKLADIIKDREILKEAQELSKWIIENNLLQIQEFSNLKNEVERLFFEKLNKHTFN